jgi:hypothetical protein
MSALRTLIRIHWVLCTILGVIAGTLSTLCQLLIWTISGDHVLSYLFRDARLTAALLLGPRVLLLPDSFDLYILIVAASIHLVLSVAYATVLVKLTNRLEIFMKLAVATGFGIALYVANLYGMTTFFAWFVQARGWNTLIAHIVFSLSVVISNAMLASRNSTG